MSHLITSPQGIQERMIYFSNQTNYVNSIKFQLIVCVCGCVGVGVSVWDNGLL